MVAQVILIIIDIFIVERVERISQNLVSLPFGIMQLIEFLQCWALMSSFEDFASKDRFFRLKSNLSKDFQAKIKKIDDVSSSFSLEGTELKEDASLLSFFTSVGRKLSSDLKGHIRDFEKDFPSSLHGWETINEAIPQVLQELDRFEREIDDSTFQNQYGKDPLMATFLIGLADRVPLRLPFLDEFRQLFARLENILQTLGLACGRVFSNWARGPLKKEEIVRTLVQSCRILFCTVNSRFLLKLTDLAGAK
jgi:hypothetical protein